MHSTYRDKNISAILSDIVYFWNLKGTKNIDMDFWKCNLRLVGIAYGRHAALNAKASTNSTVVVFKNWNFPSK